MTNEDIQNIPQKPYTPYTPYEDNQPFDVEEKKIQEAIKSSVSQYTSLYNKLQNKYTDLTNKNISQYQNVVKKLEAEISRLNDTVQRHQNKIELQDQSINQLKKTLELKENRIKTLEIEKQESNNKNNDLSQKNSNLEDQLKNHVQHISLLEKDIHDLNGIVRTNQQRIDRSQETADLLKSQMQILENKNIELESKIAEYKAKFNSQPKFDNFDNNNNNNQNYVENLNHDISELNDKLKQYITNLKTDVVVNAGQVEKILPHYKYPTKTLNQKADRSLIQAVLQRHIIETILEYAHQYFKSTGKTFHLESDIVENECKLSILLNHASTCRTGNDEQTKAGPAKLRQQIYSILINRGFNDIIGADNNPIEHPFITHHKDKLNKMVNELRVINNAKKESFLNTLAAIIIRSVIKIFWFRFRVQDPVIDHCWIPNNSKLDKNLMETSNPDDSVDSTVDLCYFPLVGKNLTSSNKEIYAHAKVVVKSTSTEEAEE